MAIKSSGTSLSFSEIRTEFGPNVGSTGVSLGRYRNSDSNFSNKNVGSLTDLPLDSGIPKTGQIKVSDFYTKKLNIIVDFHSGGTTTRVSASNQYAANNVAVVGGYTGRPTSSAGKRVIINVNKKIGSETGGNDRCALRTGGWSPQTSSLELEIGSNGEIYGAGGDGGNGGSANGGNGLNGEAGSSAIGVETSVLTKINNLGRIQAGYGGGGGGGGRRRYVKTGKKSGRWNGSTGGGGGAGAGYPNGVGGDSPTGSYGGGSDGSDGGDGTDQASGAKGAGGNDAGQGGDGQTVNNSSSKASDGQSAGGSGGTGGNGGYAIITSQGSLPTFTGNAVIGRTLTNSNPQ